MNFLNLVRNGSFRHWNGEEAKHWQIVAARPSAVEAKQASVLGFNSSGLPKASHAIQLTSLSNDAPVYLEQRVSLPQGARPFFVFRMAAKAVKRCDEVKVCIEGVAKQCFRAPLTRDWRRFRFAFHLPEENFSGNELVIRIQIPSAKGGSFLCTDVQLANMEEAAPRMPLSFRCDTFGDLAKASSRLRAWALEDYLNLLGYETCVNGGKKFDVYVCQKVLPWRKARWAKRMGKVVIYDLDDNDLARSARVKKDIERFLRLADGATAGSPFLHDILSKFNASVFLLENPVDVLERDIFHESGSWRGKLVWFGGPENVWMLRQLKLNHQVTTITQGGDVEYELKTVDEHLTAFDLALLPVALNDETLAKNANRLVKCVGLGLPFLASDTQEHRRALERLRLPCDFLVTDEKDWEKRIEDVAWDYARYKNLVKNARDLAFEVHGVETVAREWLDFCKKLWAEKQRSSPPPRHGCFWRSWFKR
ncbi:MAG: hypothetical protein V1746_04450 [bacterium]